jgi:hypothetical protein
MYKNLGEPVRPTNHEQLAKIGMVRDCYMYDSGGTRDLEQDEWMDSLLVTLDIRTIFETQYRWDQALI